MTESQVPKVYPPVAGEATIEFNDPREGTGNYSDDASYWGVWNNYFDLRLKEDGTAIVSAWGGKGVGQGYEYVLDEVAIASLIGFLSEYAKGGEGWDSDSQTQN